MRKFNLMAGILVLSALALAACGSRPAADNIMGQDSGGMNASGDMMDNSGGMMDNVNAMADTSSDEMANSGQDNMSGGAHDAMNDSMGSQDDSMMDQGQEAAMPMDSAVETPAWFDHQFTDAVSGQTFTVNDFRGKVVLLETMAMWCSNCMKQQGQVRELHNMLGEQDDFIGIGIDVDLNEDLARLATYSQDNGFDWLYSVASQEVLSGISDSLGGQFLNPPSTPIVLIDRDGAAHALPFGIKSAAELLGYVEMYLN